jgi:peptidoglycan-N-acetylglucosamine deacetylase
MRGDGDRRGAGSPPVSRRVLLAAGGAVLLTAAAAAMTAEHDARAHGARTQLRPAADGAAGRTGTRASAPSRQHPEPARHAARPPRREQPRLAYGQAMYTVDDGPKVVALTIDDGPSPVYTPQVLAILRRYGVIASFSMIGRNAAAFPGGRAAGGRGRPLHRQPHLEPLQPRRHAGRGRAGPDLAGDRCDPRRHRGRPEHVPGAVRGVAAGRVQLLRAGGLTPLAWSVDPRDWSRPGVRAIVRDIESDTRTGSIILEHDGGGNRSQTVAALTIWLPRLLEAGYQFTTP